MSRNQISPTTVSPPPSPNGRMHFQEKRERRKGELKYEGLIVRFLFGLIVISGMEYGFSWIVSGVLKSQLWPELVENMAGDSWVHEDLNGRLVFLKNELEGFVGERVSSCTSANSAWKISQVSCLLLEEFLKFLVRLQVIEFKRFILL